MSAQLRQLACLVPYAEREVKEARVILMSLDLHDDLSLLGSETDIPRSPPADCTTSVRTLVVLYDSPGTRGQPESANARYGRRSA